MKEEKKTTTRKNATKKVTRKPRVKKEEKVELNETVNTSFAKKEIVIDPNQVECVHCHEHFEKGFTICPHCHKRQGANIGLTFLIVFGIVFLFGIICFHFVDKYVNGNTDVEYKDTCTLVDYESLVRVPKEYKGKDVKVIGHVLSVEGYDTGLANEMYITLDVNMFEDQSSKVITVSFKDKKYEQGFIEGDLITVYGKYNEINGNVPNIEAKEIEFGK